MTEAKIKNKHVWILGFAAACMLVLAGVLFFSPVVTFFTAAVSNVSVFVPDPQSQQNNNPPPPAPSGGGGTVIAAQQQSNAPSTVENGQAGSTPSEAQPVQQTNIAKPSGSTKSPELLILLPPESGSISADSGSGASVAAPQKGFTIFSLLDFHTLFNMIVFFLSPFFISL